MGKKDEYQFDYLDDDFRFADQINGALFHGEQIVKAQELEPAEAQSVYLGKDKKEKGMKALVDKVRIWRGQKIHIFVIENQNYVDYQMVLRVMLSESIGYHKQWKQKKREHGRAGDLKGSDEFLSGMKRNEKFTPIITLVVYYGEESSWDGAVCLYDLLMIEDKLKPYVTNYRLNLYNCHDHDSFEEYHTGLRQVFETLRYAGDKEKLRQIMEKNKEAYSRIDSETRELLEVVGNVRIPEECKVVENGEERFDMCKAFEDMRLEGKMEGKLEGAESKLTEQIKKKLIKGKSVAVIADELEETEEKIKELIQKYRLME